MFVGSRVCLTNLARADLNGCSAVVVSVEGERYGVELERNDQRVAVRPVNLEPMSDGLAIESSLMVGSRVSIKGLQGRSDLNSLTGKIVAAPKDDNERWGVGVGRHSIAVLPHNLSRLPQLPSFSVPTNRVALHRWDLMLMRFVARYGPTAATFSEDRASLQVAAQLRQQLLFTWGMLPSDAKACVNLALAPTLVFGMLAIEPRLEPGEVFTVHCIGATPDFEGCADWSGLAELLLAADFALPRTVQITCFGNEQGFVLPPGVRSWDMMQKATGSSNKLKVTVHHVDELYHAQSRAVPNVAMLCHPGFDNYMDLWHPTLGVLFQQEVPMLIVGHSSFAEISHDAIMHQDLALAALGANIIHRQMWNPFCQAYSDPTKGSLLAVQGQEHDHCNLAVLSICRGGVLTGRQDVESFFDALDYLAMSVQGFPKFEALGPPLRNTPLHLKFRHMTESQRSAAVKLLRDLTRGTLRLPSTGSELVELFEERGLASHYHRGRGNW
mmetsp:Transcript_107876/g.170371  ORF Transcript_107876/g.170371 Transcript_107876/m.170371 type:complete len:498 (-) Transcript_107876:133-1626(-)